MVLNYNARGAWFRALGFVRTKIWSCKHLPVHVKFAVSHNCNYFKWLHYICSNPPIFLNIYINHIMKSPYINGVLLTIKLKSILINGQWLVGSSMHVVFCNKNKFTWFHHHTMILVCWRLRINRRRPLSHVSIHDRRWLFICCIYL